MTDRKRVGVVEVGVVGRRQRVVVGLAVLLTVQ